MPSPRRSSRKGKKKKQSSEPAFEYPDSCLFCETDDDNEEIFGRKVRKCGVTIHYFCMLFSSGLSQRGKTEDDGIFGFLPSDIWKEKTRGARLKCTFCRRNGATIGCVVKNCRKVFHFGCGQKAGASNQYFDSYSSFCTSHRPRQTCPVSDRLSFYGTANSMCVICMNAVEARASNDTLRAPCCKNTWFHRTCIQRQALAAGLYFFKCPLCCNKEIFQAEMLQIGIYIPEQDAAWEMEPHAYQELLEPYNHCDMDKCLCSRGRKYNKDDSKWEIIVCHWCGSQGCHLRCISGRSSTTTLARPNRWSCRACALIDEELRKERKKKKVSSPKSQEYSADMPVSPKPKLSQSERVGRKLPVKRSITLSSDGEVRDSSSSQSMLENKELTPESAANKRKKARRRNLWRRGMLFNSKKRKKNAISATITLAEALQASGESALNTSQDSEQLASLLDVSADNLNLSTSTAIANEDTPSSPVACSSQHPQLTPTTDPATSCRTFQKHRRKRSASVETDVLTDIKNHKKLCDRNGKGPSTKSSLLASEKKMKPRVSLPYVLRGRREPEVSTTSWFLNRRTLRSDKLLNGYDIAALNLNLLTRVRSRKQPKLVSSVDLTLETEIDREFRLAASSSSNYINLVDEENEQVAAIAVNKINDSEVTVISQNRKKAIYFDKENSDVIESLVGCDCIDCSSFVVISSDDDEEEEEGCMATTVLFSDTDEVCVLDNLQNQKCNDPSCDCKTVADWEYNKLEMTIGGKEPDPVSISSKHPTIAECFKMTTAKQLIQAACCSSPSLSSSSSSIITLSSSSENELGQCCNEIASNSSAFEINSIF